MGFRFHKKNNLWYKIDTDTSLIEFYHLFAKTRHLNCNSYLTSYERSNDYRRIFFQNYPPQLKNSYFCSYCGRLIAPAEVTVDHIIPISKAKRNKLTKWILEKIKIEDINDIRNLAPSCLHCNTKKGKKIGLWTIRGFLGKHKEFWFFMYSLFLLYICFLTYIIIEVMTNG